MYKHVIVKEPCSRIDQGLQQDPSAGQVDPVLAQAQHGAYVEALRQCGVAVTVLPPDEAFPDSCFVGDMAVLTERCAVLANPGAPSRRGEEEALLPALRDFYKNIERIRDPGTLEGGDVMAAAGRFYVGLSSRTNAEGARQLQAILAKYGYECRLVTAATAPHLKTGASYLEGWNLLAVPALAQEPALTDFTLLSVPAGEGAGVNCAWVNGTVLIPAGFPGVRRALEDAGYPVLAVDLSEFQKLDGGAACLSLRF